MIKRSKRSMSLLMAVVLVASLLIGSLSFAATNKFTDVPSSYWAHDEIEFIVDKGLFNGTSDTTFSPDAQMKRGQLAAVLYRYAGSPAVGSGASGYDDVDAGAYYYDACRWAKQNGIFMSEKESASSLNPNEGITRSEFAVMLYNFAKLNDKVDSDSVNDNPYTDMQSVSNEIKTAMVGWAVPAGVLNGTSDTAMSPFAGIKRSHVAAMLYRYETKIASPGSEPVKPVETPVAPVAPVTPVTPNKTGYGAGETILLAKGATYNVTLKVGEEMYLNDSEFFKQINGDYLLYHKNQFDSNGDTIASSSWAKEKDITVIKGLAEGSMMTQCLSTSDYTTVFATLNITVSGEAEATPSSGPDLDANLAARNEIVRLTNEIRAENGLPALEINDAMMDAAQEAAVEYTTRLSNWNGHDGKMEAEMLRKHGINYAGGSNIAREFCSNENVAASAIDSWVNSPGHFNTIIDDGLDNIGVGVIKSGNIWVCVQFFGDYQSVLGTYS